MGVLILGLAAAVLMLLAELSTVWSVDVVTASCSDLADPDLADQCVTRGYEAHSFALFVLALLAAVMTWGAVRGASRPAALALAVVGMVTLAIALVGDAPKVDETGRIGENFDRAEASPGPGFWMEIAGGALAVGAGGLGLASLRGSARPDRRSRRRAARKDAPDVPRAEAG